MIIKGEALYNKLRIVDLECIDFSCFVFLNKKMKKYNTYRSNINKQQ